MWFKDNTKKVLNTIRDTQPMYQENISINDQPDIRLYLIAHAPTYIPRWFRPQIQQRLPKDQYEEERTMQWPIYWAEQMMVRMGYVKEDVAQTNS